MYTSLISPTINERFIVVAAASYRHCELFFFSYSFQWVLARVPMPSGYSMALFSAWLTNYTHNDARPFFLIRINAISEIHIPTCISYVQTLDEYTSWIILILPVLPCLFKSQCVSDSYFFGFGTYHRVWLSSLWCLIGICCCRTWTLIITIALDMSSSSGLWWICTIYS